MNEFVTYIENLIEKLEKEIAEIPFEHSATMRNHLEKLKKDKVSFIDKILKNTIH